MKNVLKALLTVALATTLFTTTAATSKPQKEIVKQEFAADIDCAGCAKKVMNTLPYQKGVKDVVVDLNAKKITVKYDTSKCSDDAIVESLAKVDIKASVAKKK